MIHSLQLMVLFLLFMIRNKGKIPLKDNQRIQGFQPLLKRILYLNELTAGVNLECFYTNIALYF